MRTTIDLPDELLRRTKAAAALQGIKLKDLVATFIEQGLSGPKPSIRQGHVGHVPISIDIDCKDLPLTNAGIFEMLDRKDDEFDRRLP